MQPFSIQLKIQIQHHCHIGKTHITIPYIGTVLTDQGMIPDISFIQRDSVESQNLCGNRKIRHIVRHDKGFVFSACRLVCFSGRDRHRSICHRQFKRLFRAAHCRCHIPHRQIAVVLILIMYRFDHTGSTAVYIKAKVFKDAVLIIGRLRLFCRSQPHKQKQYRQ